MDESSRWDAEYRRQGIPSSSRAEPSGTVRWALHNWPFATEKESPRQALDVGCGTGRNARWLAGRGVSTVGIDWSREAIRRATAQPETPGATFRCHDIRAGLPADDDSVDLVLDTFVYFHQTDADVRRSYRAELRRVLRPHGLLLISLATDSDGYYSSCPRMPGPDDPPVVLDPKAGVHNVLFSEAGFAAEISSAFEPVMHWRKSDRGTMYGEEYQRCTLATLCRRPEEGFRSDAGPVSR